MEVARKERSRLRPKYLNVENGVLMMSEEKKDRAIRAKNVFKIGRVSRVRGGRARSADVAYDQ